MILAACSPQVSDLDREIACDETRIVWQIDEEHLTASSLEVTEDDVRSMLRVHDIGYSDIGANNGSLHVRIRDEGQWDQALALIQTLQWPIDWDDHTNIDIGTDTDGLIIINLTPAYVMDEVQRDVSRQMNRMQRILGEFTDGQVQVTRLGDDQLILTVREGRFRQLPTHYWRESTGEFRLIDRSIAIEDALEGNVPTGSEVLPTANTEQPYALVRRRALIDAYDIQRVTLTRSLLFRPVVVVEFDYRGTRALEQVTAENEGSTLAYVLDDMVVWEFPISSHITHGQLRLDNFAGIQDARHIAIMLQAQAPRGRLEVVSEEHGPACEVSE